jgi:hypothetical protein
VVKSGFGGFDGKKSGFSGFGGVLYLWSVQTYVGGRRATLKKPLSHP